MGHVAWIRGRRDFILKTLREVIIWEPKKWIGWKQKTNLTKRTSGCVPEAREKVQWRVLFNTRSSCSIYARETYRQGCSVFSRVSVLYLIGVSTLQSLLPLTSTLFSPESGRHADKWQNQKSSYIFPEFIHLPWMNVLVMYSHESKS
jgi:hypothetical protein